MKIILAVMDTAIEAFSTPFFVHTKAEGLRSFKDEVNSLDPNSAIAKHADDYVLYELGIWDEEEGKITPHDKPRIVSRAKDLKQPNIDGSK